MKKRHKIYLRLNITSLIFIIISFVSVTLAWFAYSGLSEVSTEIGVKAWNIELENDGQKVSNNLVISLSEIYPGMDTMNKVIKISNLGDSDASLKYSIATARILDDPKDNYMVDGETISTEYVEDILSHDYPFHVNINISKGYLLAKGKNAFFEVSISWPLDSDNDNLDSLWGTESYKFQQAELAKKELDSNYLLKSSIQIVINLTAEQYLEENTSSDTRYNLGDIVLFDVINNSKCTEVSSTCIETYIIDIDNKLGDGIVTLLPNPNNSYLNGTYNNYSSLLTVITNNWQVNTRGLLVEDLLKIISRDIKDTFLVRENLSDLIVGKLFFTDRINNEITRAPANNGYYKFMNQKFNYILANNCYWTSSEYNVNKAFAVNQIDTDNSKVYGELKSTNCKVIPIILASKSNL